MKKKKKYLKIISLVLIGVVVFFFMGFKKLANQANKEISDAENRIRDSKQIVVDGSNYEITIPDFFILDPSISKKNENHYKNTLSTEGLDDLLLVAVLPEKKTSFNEEDCKQLALNLIDIYKQGKTFESKLIFEIDKSELQNKGKSCYFSLSGKLSESQNKIFAYKRESYSHLFSDNNVLIVEISYGPLFGDLLHQVYGEIIQSINFK